MSILLFVVGAIALMAGTAMVAFGIPINEFSFGNTLIAAGATTFMGGLVILSLGAVVAQLQRVVEALATRPPMRAGRPMESFEQVAATRGPAAAARIPFPPKPKAEQRELRPASPQLDLQHDTASDDRANEAVAPMLHNPDEPPVAVAESDELPLSPRHPVTAQSPLARPIPEPSRPPFSVNGSGGPEKRHEPTDTGWRASPPPAPSVRQPQNAYFDAMWPAAEQRPSRVPAPSEARSEFKSEPKNELKNEPRADSKFEPKYESKYEPKYEPRVEPKSELEYEFKAEPEATEPPAPEPDKGPLRAEPESNQPRPESEMRAVAILKSGVVDGMSYTLYVDGSIEAELPQGTLRFASINELRSHLEKTS
jgi:hypothetical protein